MPRSLIEMLRYTTSTSSLPNIYMHTQVVHSQHVQGPLVLVVSAHQDLDDVGSDIAKNIHS